MYKVEVGESNPAFGRMLLEQFGGPNGELAAALQYSVQGINTDDPKLKDLLMDIGTEELSHLEVIGALARMHLKPIKEGDKSAWEADPLIAVLGGGGVSLNNSQGNPFTMDYLKISGQPEVDLRNNIAAEAWAKITYERLIQYTDDPGSQEALTFLMTREITHMKAFAAGLESLGKGEFEIGALPVIESEVNVYYNDSTGEGDLGADSTGPWNEGGGLEESGQSCLCVRLRGGAA